MLNNKAEFTKDDIEKCLSAICRTFDLTDITLYWKDHMMIFDYYEYKILVS